MDVGAALVFGNSPALFFGNGDGTFSFVEPSNKSSNSIRFGDIDGDGIGDVAMGRNSSAASLIDVFFGLGNRQFTGVLVEDPGSRVDHMDIGDLDNDGIAGSDKDIVAATSGGVRVFLQGPARTFTAGTTYNVGGAPRAVRIVDVNLDGNLDLLAVVDGNTLQMLAGNGDGTFQAAVGYNLGAGPRPAALVIEDFNGSGLPDAATPNLVSDDVSILLNVGNGEFQDP